MSQPDPIVRPNKRIALLMHAQGPDAEDDRPAVALSDTERGRHVDREVHLLPGFWDQSFREDRVQKSRRGPMEQRRRWLGTSTLQSC